MKAKRRNLDNSLLEEAVELVGLQHVVERVIKRTHIRIDFCWSVPGRKPSRSAGLHGGPRQDDAVDLLGEQRH